MARRGRANEVLEALRARIASGRYKAGTPLPPERELAEDFGVARMTVRRAVGRLVDEGTVEGRPGIGNFVVGRDRNGTSTSRAVGLIVPQIDNPFYATLARHMESELSLKGLNLIVASTGQDADGVPRCLARMSRERVRGLVLAVGLESRTCKTARALGDLGIPIVLMGGAPPGLPYDLVRGGDPTGVELAIDHLVGLGHTRIGYLKAIALKRSDGRLEIARASLARRGLRTGHIVEVDVPNFEGGKRGIDKLLARKSRPTAILTTNDITAIGALQRAAERGIDVPGELSIVGYDDIPMAAMAAVPLTTVSNPTDELAGLVVERVLARFGANRGRRVEIVLEPKLVVRASTAPPNNARAATAGKTKRRA
jgi:LacI family transcriptional regulator